MSVIHDSADPGTHDLGMDRTYRFYGGEYGVRTGITYEHPVGPNGLPLQFQTHPGRCLGGAHFGPSGWIVVQWEPLTISPSLACSCGDHGFIRDGKWVPA